MEYQKLNEQKSSDKNRIAALKELEAFNLPDETIQQFNNIEVTKKDLKALQQISEKHTPLLHVETNTKTVVGGTILASTILPTMTYLAGATAKALAISFGPTGILCCIGGCMVGADYSQSKMAGKKNDEINEDVNQAVREWLQTEKGITFAPALN